MTWLLTWLNVSVAILNATLQLLVIYRYRLQPSSSKKKLIMRWLLSWLNGSVAKLNATLQLLVIY